MFTKFCEIPALPFKDIEKTKRYERTDGGTDGRTDVKKVYPPPHCLRVGGITEDFKLW